MKKGNFGNTLYVSLKDSNGDPYPLTDKTVKLIYRLGGTTYEKTMAVVSAVNGQVSYTFLDTDLPVVGQMEYEVEVTGTGLKLTSETMRTDIRATIK